MKIRFRLNNEPVEIDAEVSERLVDVLRRDFGLRSIKRGCTEGICGSCTVLMNNNPVPSCMLPVFAADGADIITLEYFSTTPEYGEILAAFEYEGITLCGFCSSGTILTAQSIIAKYHNPTEKQIRDAYIGTICRCTDIISIIAALQRVCRLRRGKKHGR